MCLIIRKGQEPIIAETDITVYKVMDMIGGELGSSFYGAHFWKREKLYSTIMKLSQETSCFDDEDNIYAVNEFGYEWRESGKTEMIGAGFHSALTKERLKTAFGELLVRCTIPAGSMYYVGVDPNLIVSNQIIIHENVKRLYNKYDYGDDD